MASEVVDGLTVPLRLAGHAGLELCNTRAGWGLASPKEYLTSYDHLVVWAGLAGLLPADQVAPLRRLGRRERAAAAAQVRAAVALREAVYPVLLGVGTGADWAVVRAAAERARAAARLLAGPDHSPATWALPAGDLARPIHGAAEAVAGLLTDPVPVRACGGQGCGWLFADPHDRRRWCTMAICGNRAKAARHARRHRTPA